MYVCIYIMHNTSFLLLSYSITVSLASQYKYYISFRHIHHVIFLLKMNTSYQKKKDLLLLLLSGYIYLLYEIYNIDVDNMFVKYFLI